ncbi:SPOR domain-containing protein [Roseivirga sp. BDSF3-8]|uniref:SPOR domain-containing protein n=1 Tax=Roseivirga sp. BDSF3-8 TaxID=3241598 RepID=UPI0035323577
MIENPAHAEQLYELERRLKKSRKRNRFVSGLLMIVLIITALLGIYIIMGEVAEPPFGKWPGIRKERNQLREEKVRLKDRLDSLKSVNLLLLEHSDTATGLYYQVQIGAFRDFDLSGYREQLLGLGIETVGDVNKYTLGRFSSFERARSFRRDIIRLGIDSAFIIAYLNGELIDVREARRYEQNR